MSSPESRVPDGAEPSDAAPYTVENHLELILRALGPLQAYDQPIVESMGLPLADPLVAGEDLPRFDHAAIDGFAVNCDDIAVARPEEPVSLQVAGEVTAGSSKPFAIAAGSAVRIMSGAPLPSGTDTVVPLSDTDGGSLRVRIRKTHPVGKNVRRAGEDARQGTEVLPAGTMIGPREVGLLAALGHARVLARPRPRVVIISTGSELRDPGSELGFDAVHDVNSYMLAAAARTAGAIAYRVGLVPDSPRAFLTAVHDQLVRADLIVTSGGISDGAHDVVRQALTSQGDVDFFHVDMEPGSSQGFGLVGDEETPLIAVPGSPVAAYASFETFVLPALRRMMGLTPYRRPLVHAVLAADVRSTPGRREFVRANFEVTHRGAKVTPLSGRGSHRVAGLAEANAFIVIGDDETALNLGDTVRTLVLDRAF